MNTYKPRVVYILGAGFSAPLGLPVISNFREKSKELQLMHPERYAHFQDVFDTIRKEMSNIKNYFSADLHNIEEILSIIEMQKHFGNKDIQIQFRKYISDVVTFYTPELPRNDSEVQKIGHAFSPGLPTLYGYFVGSFFNLRFREERGEAVDRSEKNIIELECRRNPDEDALYSVITLNYDLVLENICKFINDSYNTENKLEFSKTVDEKREISTQYPFLVKLHGSVDDDSIIPPTWNKYLTDKKIVSSWKLAFKLLSEADCIRIIGYSLPIADSYVKYLLKAAIMTSDRIKNLDVLCLDTDNTVKKRYDEFIDFYKYRFKSGNVEDYLRQNNDQIRNKSGHGQRIYLTELERSHSAFYEQ